MANKTLKIDVDVSMFTSIEALVDPRSIDHISAAVVKALEKKRQCATNSAIVKASKNAVFLQSKRKRAAVTFVTVYLPLRSIEPMCDNVVPSVSPNRQSVHTDGEDGDESSSVSSSSSHGSSVPRISFSVSTDGLIAQANFDYLAEYFKHSLSMSVKPMHLGRVVDDICTYVFVQIKSSVNIRVLKNELSLQISQIVQSARVRAAGRSIIGVLHQTADFSLASRSLISLSPADSTPDFSRFKGVDDRGPILFTRSVNGTVDVFHFNPLPNGADVTFNTPWIEKALSCLDLIGVIDVGELCGLVIECASVMRMSFDFQRMEETLKTEILCYRTERNPCTQFMSVFLIAEQQKTNRVDSDEPATTDSSSSFSEADMDAIIGRTYETRGVKRSYEEDTISIEPNRNMYRRIKQSNDKRDLLHLKDTNHFTDAALKAIFQYVKSKKKLYSLNEIERLRKETNAKFPILSTKSSAYVRFEYAVRTAIFVARKHQCNLEQCDTLNIRFNMDGTLIGNKHIVAISINCVEGGRQCQTAKNLVPLGLFEVQRENTELLRTSLPAEFINDIKSVKRITIGRKEVDLRVRLGGDLMNSVYVFGLSGFSSNHPCVFCTQHKDDLYVTEDTAYDKTVTEGKGKNKTTSVIRVDSTSYHDTTKRARSLAEQALCLATGNNELGYKCEPLFGDLFTYQDYCVDTLHMKLRVFDVLLKDILSHASRTGKYGGEHVKIIEEKIRALNRHCERTVGKRFFFQIDTDDKNKTIASHGKLSGHLQDLFFIDTFPYDDILSGDIAKSARSVVDKFKEVLSELKNPRGNRKGALKRVSLAFVKEFRRSGLRTTVTPYIHTIGNHLFEFDEFNDLGDYNMQGVEKSNDLLSRLYFSSTNLAKNPLLTVVQKLYRMLEMNFENERDREAMAKFARNGVYDFVDDESDPASSPSDAHVPLRTDAEDETDDEIAIQSEKSDDEADQDTDSEESSVWAPEKRFPLAPPPRSENRFKSFRTS